MLKIGDIIETARPMSKESPLQGQRLRVKLLTPESVAHAEELVAAGRWEKVDDTRQNNRGQRSGEN